MNLPRSNCQDAEAAAALVAENDSQTSVSADLDGDELPVAVEEELAARFVANPDMTEAEKEKLKSKKSPRKETRAGK